MLILSTFIINRDTFNASHLHSEKFENVYSRADLDLYENYTLWDTDVLSEPIFGENYNDKGSRNARLAVENDKVYVVWEDNTSLNGCGADYDIFYRYYNGRIWSDIEVISEPVVGRNFDIGGCSTPEIAVENGRIYVVWVDYNETNGAGYNDDIFFRCNLTGDSWEDIQVISEPEIGLDINNGTSINPDLAVSDGKIYVVWEDNADIDGIGWDDDIFYRCNLTGTVWENIQVLSEPESGSNINVGGSSHPALAVENNNIFVVWTDGNNTHGSETDYDIFYRSNLSSSGWSPVQVLSEPVVGSNLNDRWSYYPDITVTNGKLYVVWIDSTNVTNAGHDSDIFYMTNLTGFNWEPVQVISEPVIGKNHNTKSSYKPVIAVEDDRIYVVWEDRNDTYSSGGFHEDIFIRYNLTGSFWGPIRIISEPVMGLNLSVKKSLEPDIALEHGMVHVVWHDSNNVTGAGIDYDIFYKITSFPMSLNHPQVIPPSGNTSTLFNFTIEYIHFNNIAPKEITINIDGRNYSVEETDPSDTDYIDGKFYYFTKDRLNIGNNHFFQFQASDDNFNVFSRLIHRPDVHNTPPEITTEDSKTTIMNEYYENIYEYEDLDVLTIGQPITWKFFSNASDWLTFNSYTAILNGIPTENDIGKYWINITLTDGIDIDFTNFTLTVLSTEDVLPSLTEDIMLPESGNTKTKFGFFVHYFDPDDEIPTFVIVVIDEKHYPMRLKIGKSSNGTYEYYTKLSEGEHTYYFIASDGLDTVRTKNLTTPYIEGPKKITDDEGYWQYIVLIIIIIIIIIMIILLLRRTKNRELKKKGEQ
jgi:hypothetical protein